MGFLIKPIDMSEEAKAKLRTQALEAVQERLKKMKPIIYLELKAETDVAEWEKICKLLKEGGYEIGQDPQNPLMQVIFKHSK